VGELLRHWRAARHLSQMGLALEASTTARHLSFIESGRSQPSREMVLRLARALDVPIRERNQLLLAAGYAPLYREAGLEGAQAAQVRFALERMLAAHEPFPAVVMDRHWNLVSANTAAAAFFGWLLDERDIEGPTNVIRLMFDPEGLRPFVANWQATAEALIQRVHREAVGGIPDRETVALLAEALAYPGVPSEWRSPDFRTASRSATSRPSPRWERRKTRCSRRFASRASSRRTRSPPRTPGRRPQEDSQAGARAIPRDQQQLAQLSRGPPEVIRSG
jgi:transcriptional regulator with XRE-family HTH domain